MKTLVCCLALFVSLLTRPAVAADLNLLAWSEYVPQNVIDGFTKETGIKVHYETYASNEEMLAKLSAGGTAYDVVQPSEYAVEILVGKNRLKPVDWMKVPNIKNIDPAYLHMGFDPKQQFSVPYMTGTVGIVYNADKIKTPIRGYTDVFQPAFKQRIVVLNDNREIVAWALSVQGISINDVTPGNLQKVKPTISQWLPLVKVFDSDSPKTPLINGDCDLGIVYSGDAAACCAADKKFKYVLPAEGAHQFVDSLCIPTTAGHTDEALAFMNYVLRPDVSKLISDKYPYTNPNVEARKLLSKDQLENPASYPKETKLEIFHAIGKGSGLIEKMMTALRAG